MSYRLGVSFLSLISLLYHETSQKRKRERQIDSCSTLANMSTTSSTTTCPACHQKNVKSRFSWRAILYAIFCFPCGFYCCLKRKTWYCTKCECDVVKKTEHKSMLHNNHLGYNYRLYESTETGLPASFSAYRNEAMSVSSTDSHDTTTLSTAPIVP